MAYSNCPRSMPGPGGIGQHFADPHACAQKMIAGFARCPKASIDKNPDGPTGQAVIKVRNKVAIGYSLGRRRMTRVRSEG